MIAMLKKPRRREVIPFLALFVGAGLVLVLHSWAAAPAPLMGDVNHDGVVNVFDLSTLLSKWQTTDANSDLNHDGVNIFDLSLLLSNWGATASPQPTASATPGPTPTKSPLPPTTAPTPAPGSNVINVSTAAALQAALTAAKPGDTIKMADGTYSGHFVATASGTASSPITLMGGRGAVLDGGIISKAGYTLHLGTLNSSATVSYWNLQGFTVTGGQKGVILDNVQHSTVSGLLIHQIGEEGLHVRDNSSDNMIQNNTITMTGQDTQAYGEGIYVGSAVSNWGSYSQGQPDHSNRNQLIGNNISNTGAENIDIKEGTHAGVISGNQLDGTGMCWNTSASCNFADSMIDMKGEGWTILNNTAAHMHAVWSGGGQKDDGFQVHVISGTGSEGSGTNNIFTGNTISDVDGAGFNIQSGATGVVVKCSNTVTGAKLGFGNVTCQP